MAAVADRALADARAPPVDLPGPRSGVPDWDIVDATTVTVREALLEEFPGTGDDAARKVHTVRSGGGGAPERYHVRPARAPDSRQLPIDESGRVDGRLAALASASLARRRAGDAHRVRCVIRRQDHGKPPVDDRARGPLTQECFPGPDCDALRDDATRTLDGQAIEADGPVGGNQHPRHLRLVGVQTPQGSCCCLTTLPPRIGPRPVADLDRVRGEVERRLQWDTSVHRRDEVDSERPCALKTLLPASLRASTIAARLAHTHKLQTRPPQASAPRTAAPLHPRRLAWPLAVSWQSIAHAFDLQGVEAPRRWDQSAALLTHSGKDPNWRRRPSVLDHRRGWKRQSVAHDNHRNPRQPRAASVDTYGGAANGQIRTLFESLLYEISKEFAKKLGENSTTRPRDYASSKNVLTTLTPPFLLSRGLNELNFLDGFFSRLHTQGAHPGQSDDEESTLRLHLVIILASHYLAARR